MPVLGCCSPFKNLLFSTLLSAIAIQKSNSFPLSPFQNIQTEPYFNTTNQNTRTKHINKNWVGKLIFDWGSLQPKRVPDQVSNVCLSIWWVSFHHAPHTRLNSTRPLVLSPPLVGLNHLLRYASVGCLSCGSSMK
jgi:hypothetical protein